jgi:hypothetical protein
MKQQLRKNGIPASDEEKLMSRRGPADSPARASRKRPSFKGRPAKSATKRAKSSRPAKRARTSSRAKLQSRTTAKRRRS